MEGQLPQKHSCAALVAWRTKTFAAFLAEDPDEADEEGGLATSPVWPHDWPHFEDSAKVDKSS